MAINYSAIWSKMAAHFSLGDFSPHGPEHWKQVESNGLTLCRLNGAEETIIKLFAVFHDAERENDGHDPEHGRRAAALAKSLHGSDFALDDDLLKILMEALSFHNDGLTSDNLTIGTCWDADRMDLPRVGIAPCPELMSTEQGKLYAIHGEKALFTDEE